MFANEKCCKNLKTTNQKVTPTFPDPQSSTCELGQCLRHANHTGPGAVVKVTVAKVQQNTLIYSWHPRTIHLVFMNNFKHQHIGQLLATSCCLPAWWHCRATGSPRALPLWSSLHLSRWLFLRQTYATKMNNTWLHMMGMIWLCTMCIFYMYDTWNFI